MDERAQAQVIALQNGVGVNHRTWFDQMTGYLDWKVLGPDILNPFKTLLPRHILTRMATNRAYLNQHIQIRCLCDGYEIMVISNPYNPRISSDHPCISSLDPQIVIDYICRVGLDEIFDGEIDRIQEVIREYVNTRQHEPETETTFLGKLKQKGSKLIPKSKKGSTRGFRIVRR